MRLKAFLILLVGLVAVPASASSIPILSVQPTPLSKIVGNTFSVDVDIANAVDVYAWQFDLGFDPTIVSANSVTEGSFLLAGGATSFSPGAINNATGTVSANLDVLQDPVPGVNGSGTLATFSFTAIGPGTSAFTISNVILLDSSFNPLASGETPGSVGVTAGAPSPVPEPTTLLFVGTGLVGGIRRWRRRQAAK